MIYASIVKKALRDLGSGTLADRRKLYDQLKSGLKSALEDSKPPLEARDKVIEFRLLEMTIRRFESDLRAGVDVTADIYAPEGLEAEQARLYALKVIARPRVRVDVEEPNESADDLAGTLGPQMWTLSLAAAAEGYRESPLRPGMLGAVLLRTVMEMASSQGRLGLLWIVVEPMALIGTVVAIYLVFDQRSVMNMDLVPFAILGIVSWMMIRVTAVKVAASFLGGRDLLALPPIHSISVAVGQAAAQLLIYSLVMVAALCVAIAMGHGGAPENWARAVILWIGLWVFAIAVGVSMAPLFTMWSAAPRFLLMGTRIVSWTCGIVYVSEQFPSELKVYILWNPILHGIQLLRSAYFPEYQSDDASLYYFMVSLGVVIIFAAACERLLAPRVEPA